MEYRDAQRPLTRAPPAVRRPEAHAFFVWYSPQHVGERVFVSLASLASQFDKPPKRCQQTFKSTGVSLTSTKQFDEWIYFWAIII